MKMKLTYVWLALLAIPASFQSCQQPEGATPKNSIGNVRRSESALINEARVYYNQEISGKRVAASATTASAQAFGTPVWELATPTAADTNILRVPMGDYSFTGIGYSVFLFKKTASGTMNGLILQVLFDPYYYKAKTKEFQTYNHLLNPLKHDFSGLIAQYDLSGNFVKGRLWGDGAIISDIIPGTVSQTNSATDPDDGEETDPDQGENPDPGGGGSHGETPGWQINLPGITIPGNAADPLPEWTPNDPPNGDPYPPTEPVNFFPSNSVETAPGGSTSTVTYHGSADLYDEDEASGLPCPIEVECAKIYHDGMITAVTNFIAYPKYPIAQFIRGGTTVTRKTTLLDVIGSAAPLPSPVTTATWTYFINWTYSYIPYSPPMTRQKFSSTVKVLYVNK